MNFESPAGAGTLQFAEVRARHPPKVLVCAYTTTTSSRYAAANTWHTRSWHCPTAVQHVSIGRALLSALLVSRPRAQQPFQSNILAADMDYARLAVENCSSVMRQNNRPTREHGVPLTGADTDAAQDIRDALGTNSSVRPGNSASRQRAMLILTEFDFRVVGDGRSAIARYANNSNYRNDSLIRKESTSSPRASHHLASSC